MHFFYFTPSDVQVARVDRQCIVRFCEAMSNLVDELEIVSIQIELSPHEKAPDSLYETYGVAESFRFELLPTSIRQGERRKWDGIVALQRYAAFFWREIVRTNRRGGSVIYVKNYHYAALFLLVRRFSLSRVSIFFEPHLLPSSPVKRLILSKVDGVIANTYSLRDDLVAKGYVNQRRVMGVHQGVNLDYIESVRIDRETAREHLGLPSDAFIAVYTGKVNNRSAEIEYYIELARRLPEDMLVLIVGGRTDEVEKLRARTTDIANLRFQDFVEPSKIFHYQFAADILLLYYPPGISLNDYRSPGKLFEYMASGSSILAADYPVLREVIDADSALFVAKDNVDELVRGVLCLANDPARRQRLAASAAGRVRDFTWATRAKTILRFIQKRSGIDAT